MQQLIQWKLSKVSHKETSWKNAHKGFNKFDKCNVPISIDDIKFDGKNNNDQELFTSEIDNNIREFIDNIDESELSEFELKFCSNKNISRRIF